jgi:hypothetical protein
MLFMLAVYGLAAAPWLVGRLGTRAFVVLSLVPAAAFVATLTTSRDAREGTPYTAVLPMTMRSGRAAVTSATPVSVISLAASNAQGSNSNSPGPGRERHSGIVGSEEDDQRSGAVQRLLSFPVERLAGMLLAVVTDDDGHLAHRIVRRVRAQPPRHRLRSSRTPD